MMSRFLRVLSAFVLALAIGLNPYALVGPARADDQLSIELSLGRPAEPGSTDPGSGPLPPGAELRAVITLRSSAGMRTGQPFTLELPPGISFPGEGAEWSMEPGPSWKPFASCRMTPQRMACTVLEGANGYEYFEFSTSLAVTERIEAETLPFVFNGEPFDVRIPLKPAPKQVPLYVRPTTAGAITSYYGRFVVSYQCTSPTGEVRKETKKAWVNGQTDLGRFDEGSVCRVTAVEEETPRTGYSKEVDPGPEVTLISGQEAQLRPTVTFTRLMAPFRVTLRINDRGSSGTDEAQVSYYCGQDGDGVPGRGSFTIRRDDTHVVGNFPYGARCYVTGAQAERPGHHMVLNVTGESEITSEAGVTLEATLTYASELMPLSVRWKQVPETPEAQGQARVVAECDLAGSGLMQEKSLYLDATGAREIHSLPEGSTCRLRVVAPPRVPGHTHRESPEISVQLVAGSSARAEVTSFYDRSRSELRIRHTLVDNGSTGAGEVRAAYRCSEAGVELPAEGEVTLHGTGETLVGEFFDGTTCEVASLTAEQRPGYSAKIPAGRATAGD